MKEIRDVIHSSALERVFGDDPIKNPPINVTIRTYKDDPDTEEEALEMLETMKRSIIDIYICGLMELPTLAGKDIPENYDLLNQLKYIMTRTLTTAHDDEADAIHQVLIDTGRLHDGVTYMVKISVWGRRRSDPGNGRCTIYGHLEEEYSLTFTCEKLPEPEKGPEKESAEDPEEEVSLEPIEAVKDAEAIGDAFRDMPILPAEEDPVES